MGEGEGDGIGVGVGEGVGLGEGEGAGGKEGVCSELGNVTFAHSGSCIVTLEMLNGAISG